MNLFTSLFIIIFCMVYLCNSATVMPPLLKFLDRVYKSINRRSNEGFIEDTTNFEEYYDFLVIGAGSGGSVVTNRLTEVPEWKVLLLEAGDDEPFFAEVPLSAVVNSLTSLNWGYKTDPVDNACLSTINHSCMWPRGKVLGGTSVLNFMIYTRGCKQDYDNWENLGNKGWSYKDVLPYFIKSENFKVKRLKNYKYHGVGGYLDVDESPYVSDYYDHFKTAANEMGYEFIDPNGEKNIGFSKAQATIRNGRRCSASKAFLEPIRERKNLFVSKMSRVTKILIDTKTKQAIGVEFIKNNKKIIVKAKKEVILSAGTIGSTHLLLLSGVGPKENLREFNIPVIKDSMVGFNLQDHVCYLGILFLTNKTSNLASSLVSPKPLTDYLFHGSGPLTVPAGGEGIAFMKTKYSNNTEDVPDVELMMGISGINEDAFGIASTFSGLTTEYTERLFHEVRGIPGLTITPILLAPKSKGRISLKSSNPFHWPKMEPNYFHEKTDLHKLREAAKKTVDIVQTSGFQKIGTKLDMRKYPGCEQFDLMTDEHWECSIQQTTYSLGHLVGTTKMGPATDSTSVVDPSLKVIGVSRLRVVDASIIPVIPTAHTNAVVFMIGEKASDMIKEEWLEKDKKTVKE